MRMNRDNKDQEQKQKMDEDGSYVSNELIERLAGTYNILVRRIRGHWAWPSETFLRRKTRRALVERVLSARTGAILVRAERRTSVEPNPR